MGDFVSEYYDKKSKEKEEKDKESFRHFFEDNEEVEVDSEFDAWKKEIENSENPSEKVLERIKQSLTPEDAKNIEYIVEFFKSGKKGDVLELETYMKEKCPDINPLAIFQYTMLLVGTGLVQLEN